VGKPKLCVVCRERQRDGLAICNTCSRAYERAVKDCLASTLVLWAARRAWRYAMKRKGQR
jgi:hypothetical protein